MNYSNPKHSTEIYSFFERIFMKKECEEWLMPLEEQLKYLDQKTSYHMHKCKVQRYNAETDSTEDVEREIPLILFEKVVVKFRPHLHMGDYYLMLDVQSKDTVKYKFFTKVSYSKQNEDEVESSEAFIPAYHPHLSNGVPCFGSFQGDINTSLDECNFIRFFSQMKAYLSAYYGRSTYTRGSQYKKNLFSYSFFKKQEILDHFPDYTEGNEEGQIDPVVVARDETRWGFPSNMPALGEFMIQGQDLYHFHEMTRDYNRQQLLNGVIDAKALWPSGSSAMGYHSSFDDRRTRAMAYVYTLMQVFGTGFIPAFYQIQVLFRSLYAQYAGFATPEVMDMLKVYEKSMSNIRYGNEVQIHGIKVPIEGLDNTDELDQMYRRISRMFDTSNTGNEFFDNLTSCGNVLPVFITLARSNNLHKAKIEKFCIGESSNSSNIYNDTLEECKTLMKPVYREALHQLDQTRRVILNGLKEEETRDTETSTAAEADVTDDTSRDVSEIPPLFT